MNKYKTLETVIDGKAVEIYTLENSKGCEAEIMTYGGTIVSLKVLDREGNFDDIVLGYDDLDDYLKGISYFGCLVGRYANRIAKGKFSLDGVEYVLAQNDGQNHLHGGIRGFDKVVWAAKSLADTKNVNSLELTYLSRDGEEGYPGNLSVKVIYTLTDDNELVIDYSATTDKDTIVNLTQHSYFNLAGAQNADDILNHQLQINANWFTPTDSGLIPTGEIRNVEKTPFDFNVPTAIGARIEQPDEQLKFAGGYDHNFVLNKDNQSLTLAAKVYEQKSGRGMEVYTTQPAIQFYSGNFLSDVAGKNGKTCQKHDGFCLETQHYPDSPNKSQFPSTVLSANQKYSQTTIYKFTAG